MKTSIVNKGSQAEADAAVADLGKKYPGKKFSVRQEDNRFRVEFDGRAGADGLEQGDIDGMRQVGQDAGKDLMPGDNQVASRETVRPNVE